MKIIQLLPELHEGGVERGTVELNREFVKSGHESIVMSNGGPLAQKISTDGGRHVSFDLCSKNLTTAPLRIVRLRNILRQLQPDIIHARSRVPAWLAYFANSKFHLPFVTTVHGIYSVNPYSRIMTQGDAVICISEVLKEHIEKNYGTDPRKITVIQRGADLDYFDPERIDHGFVNKFKTDFGLWDKYVVTSIGRITYLKDYESFIKSIALVEKDIPEIRGVIVGGTTPDKVNYLQSLKKMAADLGVTEKIFFVGSQTRMPEIYGLSDLTVNASLTMGNVGRTVVESLAMDKPALATTYRGLANLVQDGENGFIIETQNPVDLAAKIRLARTRRFKNIRAGLNPEYTLKTMVAKTLGVYDRLLAEKRRQGRLA